MELHNTFGRFFRHSLYLLFSKSQYRPGFSNGVTYKNGQLIFGGGKIYSIRLLFRESIKLGEVTHILNLLTGYYISTFNDAIHAHA